VSEAPSPPPVAPAEAPDRRIRRSWLVFAGSFVTLAAIVVLRLGAQGASLVDWIVIALLGVAGAAGLVNRQAVSALESGRPRREHAELPARFGRPPARAARHRHPTVREQTRRVGCGPRVEPWNQIPSIARRIPDLCRGGLRFPLGVLPANHQHASAREDRHRVTAAVGDQRRRHAPPVSFFRGGAKRCLAFIAGPTVRSGREERQNRDGDWAAHCYGVERSGTAPVRTGIPSSPPGHPAPQHVTLPSRVATHMRSAADTISA